MRLLHRALISIALFGMTASNPANALVINATFDSNWLANAPTAATAAVNAVDALFGSMFSNPGTVNITFGWNEVNGTPISGSTIGATMVAASTNNSLATVQNLLSAYSSAHPGNAVLASVVANIPASVTNANAGGSSLFYIPGAQYTALTGTSFAQPDAYVGFGGAVNWQYTQTGGIASNAYDFTGTVIHEITHALGRVNYEFVTTGTPYLTPLDLTRYTCGTTTLNSVAGSTACFSVNGGATDLATFSAVSDSADWASTPAAGVAATTGSPNNAILSPGVTTAMTPADYTVMQALGWTLSPATALPEPGTLLLFAPVLAGMVFRRFRDSSRPA